jgi:two-component system, NarL family, response regulator NreC
MKRLQILLADDHQVVRDGLRVLIDSQPDMRVVAEAGNGAEALALARRLKPELVIMDVSMPQMNGLKATEALKAELPEIKVLVLTTYEDQTYFRHMCQLNASGYVLKRSAGGELLGAIRKVASGQLHFDNALLVKTLVRQLGVSTNPTLPPARHLSDREEQVLRGVAFGYTNKELASLLGLSVKTVETHKVRICEKFGFCSRADMVLYAVRQGWLEQTLSFAHAASA